MIEKILVFGGKGGVGKSTISCATAVKISDMLPNKKVLLISFDIAHNLTDIFGMEVGNELTTVKDNLWAIEPDPHRYADRVELLCRIGQTRFSSGREPANGKEKVITGRFRDLVFHQPAFL